MESGKQKTRQDTETSRQESDREATGQEISDSEQSQEDSEIREEQEGSSSDNGFGFRELCDDYTINILE